MTLISVEEVSDKAISVLDGSGKPSLRQVAWSRIA